MKLIGLSGSLRNASYSRRLLDEFGRLLDEEVTLETFDVGQVPHYNGDLDGEQRPAIVNELVAKIEAADGLVIVTPEYNYAIPGVLKNALDWASRPAYKSCLAGKPTAVMASSMGAIGGARALANLRQILAGTITDVFPHPEVLVGGVHKRFEGDGSRLTDERTRKFIQDYAHAFIQWAQQR